jgi:hypothetical protein
VRVAVGVMAVLAVLLLLNAVLVWIGRDGVANALVDANGISRAQAEQDIVVWLIPRTLIGLMLLMGALFLRGGRRWALWTGMVASAALAALTLISSFAVGASSPESLLALVLSLAAITSLAARPTKAWVARPRAGG